MVPAMQSQNPRFDAASLVLMLILVAVAGLYLVSQIA